MRQITLKYLTYKTREVLQHIYIAETHNTPTWCNRIARHVGTTPHYMFMLVQDLKNKGFIEITESTNRCKHITLTKKGKDIAKQFANIDTILNEV